MPKSSKKKKEQASDFKKAKLKLGKGKKPASNATDTSFKARTVALPKQSISVVKGDDTPKTRRNLTFDELVAHAKHYNAGVRIDALQGFRELLSENPPMIMASLGTLINTCLKLISDNDALVRKALISFLAWLLPIVPMSSLKPHASVLMLFTTSALSHIFPEIRIDAVRLLDVLLEVIPEVVIDGWPGLSSPSSSGADNEDPGSALKESNSYGGSVLDGYLALLDLKGKPGEKAPVGSMSCLMLSANSKLILLKSLSKFLRVSLTLDDINELLPSPGSTDWSEAPCWYFASSFQTQESFQSFTSLTIPTRTATDRRKGDVFRWTPIASNEQGLSDDEKAFGPLNFPLIDAAGLGEWSLDAIESSCTTNLKAESHEGNAVEELVLKLHSALVSTWLDVAPSVFTPSVRAPFEPINVELLHAVGQIASTLYVALLAGDSGPKAQVFDNLRILLGYMAVYFPFDVESIHGRDAQSEQLLQELGLLNCELTSLYLTCTRKGSKNGVTKSGSKDLMKGDHVGEYVVQALQGKLFTSSRPMGVPLSAAAYISLLPTVWSLVNSNLTSPSTTTAESMSDRVLTAVLRHGSQASSMSAVKRPATEFISRLSLVTYEPMYRGSFKLDNNSPFHAEFVQWVLSLPRFVWELGNNNLPAIESTLLFVIRMCQRRPCLLNLQEALELRRRMCPCFSVDHPTKGVILGPFTKIQHLGLRRLFLEVVLATASPAQANYDDVLFNAALRTVVGTPEENFLREGMELL